MKMYLFGFAAVAALTGSALAQYTENFDDPFGDWTMRWLYQNATIGNYYVAAGDCDESNRGNNPQGLWVVDTQACGAGVGGSTCTVVIDPSFGAGLNFFQFGVEAFTQQDIKIYDMNDNVVGSLIGVSGGGFDFDHKDIVSANSAHGISKIVFDSTAYGGGQIEGNTSVDNFIANGVPTPGAAGLLGIAGIVAGRRRR